MFPAKLYSVRFQSYGPFCSIIFPISFLKHTISGSLASMFTSTSGHVKWSPYFFSVLCSAIKGHPILLSAVELPYLKSNPGNFIQMGMEYNSPLVNSVSGSHALTIKGLSSKWYIPPCNTSLFPQLSQIKPESPIFSHCHLIQSIFSPNSFYIASRLW